MDPNYGDPLGYMEINDDNYMNSEYDNMKLDELRLKDSIIATWSNGLYNELYGGASENDESGEDEEPTSSTKKKSKKKKDTTSEDIMNISKVCKAIVSAKKAKTTAKSNKGKTTNCSVCKKPYKNHDLKLTIETKNGKQYRKYSFGVDGCHEAVIPLKTTLPQQMEILQEKVTKLKEDIIRLKCNNLFGYDKDQETADMTELCIQECMSYMDELIKTRKSYEEIVGSSGDIPVNYMKSVSKKIEEIEEMKKNNESNIDKEQEKEEEKFSEIIKLEYDKHNYMDQLSKEKELKGIVRTNCAIMKIEKQIREKRYALTERNIKIIKYKAPVKHGILPNRYSESAYSNDVLENTDADDFERDDTGEEGINVGNRYNKEKRREMIYLLQEPFTKKTLEVDLDANKSINCSVPNEFSKSNIYTMTIIVPFRAKDKNDERNVHLKKFKERMKSFLTKVHNKFAVKGIVAKINVVIVEQSDDKQKFNRGALLNAGYLMHPDSTVYIFHDVDLLPQDNMVNVYATKYTENSIVHFAGGWKRYNTNPDNTDNDYIGGVTLIGKKLFENINGFPNDYQGWGGEDDEIMRRLNTLKKSNNLRRIKIEGYKDLEGIKDAKEKRNILNMNPGMDNREKLELKNQHKATWKNNGISLGKENIFSEKPSSSSKTEYEAYYTLYETTVEIKLGNILQNKFKNENLPPSSYTSKEKCSKEILPFITNEDNFKLLLENINIETFQNETPLPKTEETKKIPNLPSVYKTENNKAYTYEDVLRTFHYMFRKIRLGVFIVIAEGKLQYFIPFQNIYYKNDWDEKNFKYNIGGKEVTQEEYKKEYSITAEFENWSANDCILGTWNESTKKNKKKDFDDTFEIGDQGWNEMRELISDTCDKGGVRNCVLFYNRRDFPVVTSDWREPYRKIYGDKKDLHSEYKDKPFVPIIGYCNYDGYDDILVPNYADWRLVNPGKFYPSSCSGEETAEYSKQPWDKKKDMVIFRGSATGCGIDADTNKRIAVVELAQEGDNGKILNAKLTGLNRRDKIYGRDGNNVLIGRYEGKIEKTNQADIMYPAEQSEYKYVLHIDGHVAAYRLGRELDYNSCILKMEGYENYKLWFSDQLKPYDGTNKGDANIINVTLDGLMKEIKSIMKEENEDVSRKIASNAKELYGEIMTKEYMTKYMKEKLNMISSNFYKTR
jgi:hypothetical protein